MTEQATEHRPAWLTDDWVREYPDRARALVAWLLDISEQDAADLVGRFLDTHPEDSA